MRVRTKPLARRTLRVLHSASHAAPRGLVSRFSLLLDFGNYCKVCRLQARIHSIPIADSPRPPQTPAASSKRPNQKWPGITAEPFSHYFCRATPDWVLTFIRIYKKTHRSTAGPSLLL